MPRESNDSLHLKDKSADSFNENKLLKEVLLEHIIEQRRARRWRIFFKILFILIFISALFIFSSNRDLAENVQATKPHTAVVDIKGEISHENPAGRENVRLGLKKAFENTNVKAIVLRINSPGGSPVQSRQIFDDIQYFRAKYPNTKIYAAIEDMGTSAGYLIACAADSIFADKTSLVGSIGVRIDSFGVVEGIRKLGIERRLYTAGQNKGLLDPFLPEKPSEKAFIEDQLNKVHFAFIQNVKEGRGKRLAENADLFSGLFWCGEDALRLGLIDGFGDVHSIARDLANAPTVVDYTNSMGIWDRLSQKVEGSAAKSLRNIILGYSM